VSNDKDEKKKILARMIAGRTSMLTPKDVDAVRSTKGEIKGFLTQDTLYRLQKVLADHQKADDKFSDGRIALILGLCDAYIKRHRDDANARAREKVTSVQEIKAQAMVDRDRRKAEAIYLEDAYAGADPNATSPTAFVRQSLAAKHNAVPNTKKLATGQIDREEPGLSQMTLDLIKQYGLTEAEVLAVKVYTAQDYTYMNPATANSESYMVSQNFDKDSWKKMEIPGTAEAYLASPEGRKHLKQLFEEGSLHGAMAVAALKKLPSMQGTCYRGERMTEKAFRDKYGDAQNWKKPTTSRPNFTSLSRVRAEAQRFADGKDCKGDDKTVSVFIEAEIKTGRDVRDLSVLGKAEEEWLLLPGTKLETISVEQRPSGTPGDPIATRWVFVKEREV
jgi:hypothetical protein